MLFAKFGEIGPVVLEKKRKMWKVHRQTDGQTTDNRRSEKLMSFQLLEIVEIKAAYTIKEKITSIIFMKIRIRYLVPNKTAIAEGTIS